MFKFSLRIDDEEHSLSKEKGISFDKIGELLQNLYKAIDPKSIHKCTLGQIRGNCYALDWYSEDEAYSLNFVNLHKNIEAIPITELEPAQKEYASSLKKILGGKYFAEAYNSNNEKIASIKDIGKNKTVEVFYTTKTVYGIISQLGAPSLDASKKHISIDGIPYKIIISKTQDIQLKPYYGTDKLMIKLRQRRSIEKSRIIDAELLSFTIVSKLNLIDNLEEAGYIEFDLIKNTHTIEDVINKIYTD